VAERFLQKNDLSKIKLVSSNVNNDGATSDLQLELTADDLFYENFNKKRQIRQNALQNFQ